jgi:hypothetical protein
VAAATATPTIRVAPATATATFDCPANPSGPTPKGVTDVTPALGDTDDGVSNTGADGVELSAEQIDRLNDLRPAAGNRHDEANMAAIDG